MATLEINNNLINFKSKEYLNIKSLLPKLQKQFPLDSYEIKRFEINGSNVDFHSEDPKLMSKSDIFLSNRGGCILNR